VVVGGLDGVVEDGVVGFFVGGHGKEGDCVEGGGGQVEVGVVYAVGELGGAEAALDVLEVGVLGECLGLLAFATG
jgi:hypothetical protein